LTNQLRTVENSEDELTVFKEKKRELVTMA
jgi:hypothetical protein